MTMSHVGSIANYQKIRLFGTDTFSHWPSNEVKLRYVPTVVFGLFQVLFGLLSVALGVGAICSDASGYFIAYGIWCGFIFTLSGAFSIAIARCGNMCLATTNMVLGIVAVVCGAIQFSIGVVAAANDANGNTRFANRAVPSAQYLTYDIFYTQNDPSRADCSGSVILSWSASWAPIDILLLLCGFGELVFSLVTAILSCTAICCETIEREFEVRNDEKSVGGAPSVVSVSRSKPNGSGIYNEGYLHPTYDIRPTTPAGSYRAVSVQDMHRPTTPMSFRVVQ